MQNRIVRAAVLAGFGVLACQPPRRPRRRRRSWRHRSHPGRALRRRRERRLLARLLLSSPGGGRCRRPGMTAFRPLTRPPGGAGEGALRHARPRRRRSCCCPSDRRHPRPRQAEARLTAEVVALRMVAVRGFSSNGMWCGTSPFPLRAPAEVHAPSPCAERASTCAHSPTPGAFPAPAAARRLLGRWIINPRRPQCAFWLSAAAVANTPSSTPSPRPPWPRRCTARPATPASSRKPTRSPSAATTLPACWRSPSASGSTSPSSVPRRPSWPASPTSSPKTASSSSAPPRGRPARGQQGLRQGDHGRRHVANGSLPAPRRPRWRAARRATQDTGRSWSRPTVWPPARACSSAATRPRPRPPSACASTRAPSARPAASFCSRSS